MDALLDDFHDSFSSYEEILDFDPEGFEEEKVCPLVSEDDEFFYRSLEEY